MKCTSDVSLLAVCKRGQQPKPNTNLCQREMTVTTPNTHNDGPTSEGDDSNPNTHIVMDTTSEEDDSTLALTLIIIMDPTSDGED